MLACAALFSLATLAGISAATNANRVVRVNVGVFDPEGHAIAGLDRGDFSLQDNGEQRSISAFKALRPSGKLLRTRAASGYWISNRPDAEHDVNRPATIILLDAQNTGPQYQPWSISQIARFTALLGPEEQIAVYQLRQDGLFLLHEFTGNHQHLLAAIAPEAMVHNAKTNKWQLDYRRIRVLPASSPFGLSTYRALERLACQMSRYSGRKNLFWISLNSRDCFRTVRIPSLLLMQRPPRTRSKRRAWRCSLWTCEVPFPLFRFNLSRRSSVHTNPLLMTASSCAT